MGFVYQQIPIQYHTATDITSSWQIQLLKQVIPSYSWFFAHVKHAWKYSNKDLSSE